MCDCACRGGRTFVGHFGCSSYSFISSHLCRVSLADEVFWGLPRGVSEIRMWLCGEIAKPGTVE